MDEKLRQMFGRIPDGAYYMAIGNRLVKLAYTFTNPPRIMKPCCIPQQDGDMWRLELCVACSEEVFS